MAAREKYSQLLANTNNKLVFKYRETRDLRPSMAVRRILPRSMTAHYLYHKRDLCSFKGLERGGIAPVTISGDHDSVEESDLGISKQNKTLN